MSQLAVSRAIARIEGHTVLDRELVVSPHLVVRGTSAKSGLLLPKSTF